MFDHPVSSRSRWALALVAAVALCCLIVTASGAIAHPIAATHRAPPKATSSPRASRAQSRAVLSCLRRGHLQHVTTSGPGYLWVGWDAKVGGFLYVQYYKTLSLATRQAKFLRDEESGVASHLVIAQHITPYNGSPVPAIVKCLHGRMISKPPKKQPPFRF